MDYPSVYKSRPTFLFLLILFLYSVFGVVSDEPLSSLSSLITSNNRSDSVIVKGINQPCIDVYKEVVIEGRNQCVVPIAFDISLEDSIGHSSPFAIPVLSHFGKISNEGFK